MKKKIVLIMLVVVSLMAGVTQADVLYQSDFTGADLGAGTASSGVDGAWVLNDADDRAQFDWIGRNARASLHSASSFQSDGGFTLEVSFLQHSQNPSRFSIGLVEAGYTAYNDADWLNQAMSGAYGIGLSISGAVASAAGSDVLAVNDGTTIKNDLTSIDYLSTAQGNTTYDVLQTLSMTVTSTGWSYSLNGATATEGTFDGYTFDLSKSYQFVGYNQISNITTPAGEGSYFSNVTLVRAESLPIPTLSTASNPVSAFYTVNIDFTEAVTGLEESDFSVSNGSVTPFSISGSGDTYAIEITPLANGDVEVTLLADSVINSESNTNPASNTLTTLYIAPGSDQPSVALSTASDSVSDPYTVDVIFDEPVTGLALSDFVVTNGVASGLSGSDDVYSILITPEFEGDVSVTLPADTVTDTDGDGFMNTASSTLITDYWLPDYPTVVLYGKLSTNTTSYEVFLTFSEDVTGLDASDFLIVNGFVTATAGTGRYYSATIEVASPGTMDITLPADSVTDLDGGSLPNSVSNTKTIQCTSNFSEQWVIDDAASWTAATSVNSNLNISGGFAEPLADSSQFTSIVKTFPVLKKATTLTFKQSPVWDNWSSIANTAPGGDALVFIPVADNDYYILGLSSGSVYHAWHSTDMVNWTHHGPVVSGVHGRWVTTAEYKDGVFYIYSDYTNDHIPYLFKDSDLKDGVPGTLEGIAFNNPGHGSDNSVFRDDEDGLFHMIYEDWSPIYAQGHSWDSPLAGHTSSADGKTGFDPHEHQPPVDERTTPTGVFVTYPHPHTPEDCVYEIHEPEQNAFGDWTTIKIGSQYYLFSDYDPAGGSIHTARFTSDSLYKEFDRVGEMGSGHPDNTVGFAEGQFYLISQSGPNYTSSGPWVDGVEARAGVDTDGDGVSDQWTSWQTVFEQYDHKAGYVRVVERTPAQLDLSGLAEGYGFQYEFRVDDTVVSGIPPIMDRVEMEFDKPCDYFVTGDRDFDCDVDLDDYRLLAISWFNGCGVGCETDMEDFASMAFNWLTNCIVDSSDPFCIPVGEN